MSKITKRKYVEQEVMEYVLPSEHQQIVKVMAGRGNNLHEVSNAEDKTFLVSMPSKFRKNIWIKRGDFIIVDPIEEGDKVKGEIAHILFPEHIEYIQQEGLWPKAFGENESKSGNYIEDDMLPPSDSEDEDLATMVVNANKGNQLYEEEEEEDYDEEEEEKEKGLENCDTEVASQS